MRYFCTYFDANYLTRGLALYRSLAAHAGEFQLTVLCLDEKTEATLRAMALPQVRLLPVAQLTTKHARLAACQADRSKLEFYFTCAPWLMQEVLPSLPAGEILNYLDADLYFFSTPEPIFAEIGCASVAITPHRFPPALSHLERYGKFNVGWVTLRHNATGLACAADWAEKCATWCFNVHEAKRYANQGYVDTWHQQFPGTISITHGGANVAPWNVRDSSVMAGPSGVEVNHLPLIFYHFHALTHLGEELYDPYLSRYDAVLTPTLRNLIYLPYLKQLQPGGTPAGEPPDLLPLTRPGDPRNQAGMKHLVARLRVSELDRDRRLRGIERSQAANEQTLAYLRLVEKDRDLARAELQQTVAYLHAVEKDSAERLASIHHHQEKLKTANADLDRNVAYLKLLEAEIAAHVKVSADKDAIIAHLAQQLQSASALSPTGR